MSRGCFAGSLAGRQGFDGAACGNLATKKTSYHARSANAVGGLDTMDSGTRVSGSHRVRRTPPQRVAKVVERAVELAAGAPHKMQSRSLEAVLLSGPNDLHE